MIVLTARSIFSGLDSGHKLGLSSNPKRARKYVSNMFLYGSIFTEKEIYSEFGIKNGKIYKIFLQISFYYVLFVFRQGFRFCQRFGFSSAFSFFVSVFVFRQRFRFSSAFSFFVSVFIFRQRFCFSSGFFCFVIVVNDIQKWLILKVTNNFLDFFGTLDIVLFLDVALLIDSQII